MRGFSGAMVCCSRIVVGSVTLPERRPDDLRELLLDLARPGLCLVIGAGASRDVVPMSMKDIAEFSRELLQAGGSMSRLPRRLQREAEDHPECLFLADLLREAPPGAWDRVLADIPSPGQASYVLNEAFTPRGKVPEELVHIYDVLENCRGTLVTYNYDRITDHARRRFRLICPHGERSSLFSDPRTRESAKRVALQLHVPIGNSWWLPVPETVEVQYRPAYRDMLNAWALASSIVFVGYGFGGGADALSFEDFGLTANPTARVHVLCPNPDNVDLSAQVGYALHRKVFSQPYRWGSLAKAVLDFLSSIRSSHIRYAIGAEREILFRHDRG